MAYDFSYFDKMVDRVGSGSAKWDGLELYYGKSGIVPMWVADTDFRAPQEVIDAIIKRAEHGVFGYSLTGEFYKDAPINWHLKRNNIEYKKENIFFVPNVVVALNNTLRAITNQGDTVLVLNPTYGPLEKQPIFTERKPVVSKMKKVGKVFKIDFEDFEKKIIDNDVKAYILCNPHNPTGRVWSKSELKQMFEICKKHNVIIISDEIHGDLIMPGNKYTPAMEVARKINYEQRLVMLSAPTKTFNMAGLQVAYYMTENKEFQEKINKVKEYSKTTDLLNSFSYIALEKSYEYGGEYVDTLTEYLYSNYNYLKSELAQKCPELEVTNLEATYLVWIDASKLPLSGPELRQKMVDYGVAIQTGEDFFEEDELYFRVNIGCPRETLEKGVAAIVSCIQSI
ncbi:MalY/PatB family protein [Vagococcus silagei]|uniref:cysteine-S-conjugate beta-lyase n=1 Tax=Vagococcus silagei TaxID=2508885 RepID=A0A4S3B040_9ENTE|nr:PatB family C-S lyase [Vagococcus silagei]THB60371.1 putative C-S lyase [Vagococcus silagei]